MESIRDKVAIIGMGCVKSGEHWGKSEVDLAVDAAYEAYADAGIDPKEIQAAWVSNGQPAFNFLNYALKLDYVPVSHVANACASGGDAFRTACAFVAAGVYDIVLALGATKLKDAGTTGIGMEGGLHAGSVGMEEVIFRSSVPVHFAIYATRYAHEYGYSVDEVRRALARVSVKNHRHGALNPRAHFQKEISMEDALNAPMIAWPLGLYDCCANVDGAAAAIITRPEIAKHFRDDYMLLKGFGVSTGGKEGRLRPAYKFTEFPENEIAARTAYEQAGIKDPFKELSHVEIHDAFSVNELVVYEDIGLAPKGAAPKLLHDGVFDLEGKIPTNTDGGLKCTGHPPPATGIKQIYEAYKQCQGKAGPRQVKDVRYSLTHNQGGAVGSFTTVIHIFSPRD